jgi:protein subunit release factor A
MTETEQSHRERSHNQRDAFRRLARRVVGHYVRSRQRERHRSLERVRTYDEPDNRVVDHASGLQLSYSEIVGEQNLAPMIDARLKASIADDG